MTKIDNRNTNKALFKNTGIIAIGQVSTKIVNFLLLPLYTALLTTEEYGIVDLLSTLSTLLVVVVGLQMNQAIFRFLITKRDYIEKLKIIISTIMFATFEIFGIYILLFLVLSPFISLQYKWFLLGNVITVILLQTTSGIARGLGKNAEFALANFISSTVIIVLNVIFIAILRMDISAMLVAYIIGPFVGSCVLVIKCKLFKYISWKMRSKNMLKEVLMYSIPLVPNELSWSIIHSSDRWVVASVLSVAANGLIAVASKFSVIYTTAFSIFNASWTEQVVLHYKDEGGPEYINSMFNKMVTLFACLAMGIIACMPFIFNVLVNIAYNEAYGLVPFYMIAVFFNAIIGLISSIYLVNNETKQVAISTMIAAGINLVVDLLLIKSIGYYAAPISSICGYMVISIWRLIDVNKRHCRISISIKKSVALVTLLLVVIVGYYSKEIILQLSILIVVAIISFLINKELLLDMFSPILKRIKK